MQGDYNILEIDRYLDKEGNRLKKFFEKLSDGIFLTDIHWTVVFWNAGAGKIFGLGSSEVVGKNLWQVYKASTERDFERNLLYAKNAGKPYEFESFCRTNNVWLEVKAYPSNDGLLCCLKDITRKKALQDELVQLRNHQAIILNTTTDMIWLVGHGYQLQHANRAFYQALEKDLEMHIQVGDNLLAAFPETLAARWKMHYENAFAGQTIKVVEHLEHIIPEKNKIFEVVLTPVFDAAGQVSCISCQSRDITNQVNAEKYKADNDKRLAALVKRGLDMVMILTETGTITYVTPNIELVLGFTQQEVTGRCAFEFVHQQDLEHAMVNFAEIVADKDIRAITIRCIDKNGNYRYIEMAATNFLKDPTINGIVLNTHDVTERTQITEELKRANQRFSMVMQVTNEVIWEWEPGGSKTYSNKNYQRIFGYSQQQDTSGLADWMLRVHPDDRKRVARSLENLVAAAQDGTWQQEYRFLKADGTYAYVADRGVLVKNAQNEPVKVVGSMNDITSRKLNELEKEAMIRELTDSNDDLKQFSFITSHNLRAPLSNIQGLLNIINHKTLDEDNQKVFEMLRTSSNQLYDVIEDLTKIIVIRSHSEMTTSLIDIPCCWARIQPIFLNALHDIPFTIEQNFQVTEMFGHRPYLESIFINLLSNAIKFRNRQKSLHIKVVTYLSLDNELTLEFTDNGIGLNIPMVKDRLFGLYQRFHNNSDGKGLGLFMVKSQVHAMGGKISIESEVNVGTMVVISLPLRHEV